jgi:MraZ protein
LAFHGTFDHTLDVKNRITVPSKFRAALAGTVFVVRGAEPCLSVYPEAEYQRLTSESLRGLAPLSPQYKKLRRLFNGRADDVELDGAGRIALKAKQLEHAGISGRDAVVVGAGDCLEIWDRAAWEASEADLTAEAPELTASLGHPA